MDGCSADALRMLGEGEGEGEGRGRGGGEGNGVEWDKLISHSEVINRLRHVGSV